MSTHNPELTPQPHAPTNFDIQPDASDFHEAPEVPVLPPVKQPLPPWFFVLIGLALFFLGTSFAGFTGFTASYDQGPGAAIAPPKEIAVVELPPAVLGKKIFSSNCVACHQADGKGQPGSYPPLAGSHYVNGPKERLAAILLRGLQGGLSIHGQSYNGQMSQYATMSNKQLADLLTYIRSDWGNTGDAVTEDDIDKARAEFKAHSASYVQPELDAMPGGPEK